MSRTTVSADLSAFASISETALSLIRPSTLSLGRFCLGRLCLDGEFTA